MRFSLGRHPASSPPTLPRRAFLQTAAALGVVGAAAGCSSAKPLGGAATLLRARDHTPESERSLPGTRNWHLHGQGSEHEIEGYAVPASGRPGQPVQLMLTSSRRHVRVEAFRIGWYAGLGARRVATFDHVRVGDQMSRVAFSESTRTVSTDWDSPLTVTTDGWAPGAYLFRLTADSGAQRYVPYVVTSPDTTGRLLLVHSTATWQAYNAWGGRSLYHGPGGLADYDNRSYVVSYDRPFDANGAAQFGVYEQSVVQLADRLALPLAHTTSTEIDADPSLAAKATAIVSLGHDEYWSMGMRRNVTAARDAGTNVAFLGANACFRRIRFDSSALGAQRRVVCYKTDYELDPMYGVHDAVVTNDWREPPHPDPESTLIGTLYEAFPTEAAYTVVEPAAWLYRRTGVGQGETFANLVGPEYDRVNPIVPLRRPMMITAHSRLICKGVKSFSDTAYYTRASGAGVLNVGTMRWIEAMTGANGNCDRRTGRFVSRVTANVLTAFARPHAAESLPAHDNIAKFHPWAGDPTYEHHDLW